MKKKKKVNQRWLPRAWKESQRIEAKQKALEVRALVRRLYELLLN